MSFDPRIDRNSVNGPVQVPSHSLKFESLAEQKTGKIASEIFLAHHRPVQEIKIDPLKTKEWTHQFSEYQDQMKQLDAILNKTEPFEQKDFIFLVNFYHDHADFPTSERQKLVDRCWEELYLLPTSAQVLSAAKICQSLPNENKELVLKCGDQDHVLPHYFGRILELDFNYFKEITFKHHQYDEALDPNKVIISLQHPDLEFIAEPDFFPTLVKYMSWLYQESSEYSPAFIELQQYFGVNNPSLDVNSLILSQLQNGEMTEAEIIDLIRTHIRFSSEIQIFLNNYVSNLLKQKRLEPYLLVEPKVVDFTPYSSNEIKNSLSYIPHTIEFLKVPKTIDGATLAKIIHSNPNLIDLNLSDCDCVTDDLLELIANSCPHLTHLHLSGCVRITDQGLGFILSKCLKITHLSLNGCRNITAASLKTIAETYQQLNHLDFGKCKSIDEQSLIAIGSHCRQLRYLNVNTPFDKNESIQRGLMGILKDFNCPHLSHFIFRDAGALDNDVYILIAAKYRKQLSHLEVEKSYGLTDIGMRFIGKFCDQLSVLSLDGASFTNEGLEAINQGCPNITQLSLKNCSKIQGRVLQNFIFFHPELTVLNLNGSLSNFAGKQLHDILSTIGNRCAYLTELDLSNHHLKFKSYDYYYELKSIAGSDYLTRLSLESDENFNNDTLSAVLSKTSRRRLMHLNLGNCKKVSNTGLKEFSKSPQAQLLSLNLNSNQNINDSGLLDMATGCPNLTHLDLSNCNQITEKGIAKLIEKCPHLTQLNLANCKKIVSEKLIHIIQMHPHLSIQI